MIASNINIVYVNAAANLCRLESNQTPNTKETAAPSDIVKRSPNIDMINSG